MEEERVFVLARLGWIQRDAQTHALTPHSTDTSRAAPSTSTVSVTMDSSSNPPPGNFSEQARPPPQFFAGACCRCTTTPSTAPPLAPTLEKPSDEILTLEAAIDSLDDDLRELSLDIHGHPEVGWKEFRTHDGALGVAAVRKELMRGTKSFATL
mgnify:CR=1 FL=1